MKQNQIETLTESEIKLYGLKPSNIVKNNPLAHESEVTKGKYYTVVHAVLRDLKPVYDEPDFILVPVFPFLHKDPSFSTQPEHYHIDGRFKFNNDYFEINNGITTNAIFLNLPEERAWNKFVKLVYVRKKCVRLSTGLDVVTKNPHKWIEWYKTMEGKSCAGKRCPHYGTKMIDRGDHYFCPMHNLIGCSKTEKILNYEDTRHLQPC